MYMTRVLVRSTVILGSVVSLVAVALLGGMEATVSAADTTPGIQQTATLTKREKQQLVENGVTQYEAGNKAAAQKMLEQAVAIYPENYMAPYFLGMIYLENDRITDTIAQWQNYVSMAPQSKESTKIRKYLSLMLRREAKAQAKLALAYEDSLKAGTVSGHTIAVTSYRNLGTAQFDTLGKGMAAMLITDLSQIPDLQVIERVKIQVLMDEMELGATELIDSQSASRMGRLLKAGHITTGSLTDLEQKNLQIASLVMDTQQKQIVGMPEAKGALADFFELEKRIACGILESLSRDCGQMPEAFNKIHTKSMPALIAYSEGLDAMDHERYDVARNKFQQALDADPDFELAEEALLSTPLTMMLGLTSAEMAAGASASGLPAAASGAAVVGGTGIGTTTAIITGAVAAGGAAALIAGGGGGSDGDGGGPTAPDISGDWRGTWNDGGGGGLITLNLTQNGPTVGGSVSIVGSDCLSTGDVSGDVTGDQVRLTISGAEQARFSAVYSESSLHGTIEYTTGECQTATVSLNLTGGATIEW